MNRNGNILLVGCPRGGTSVLTGAMRCHYGADKVLGGDTTKPHAENIDPDVVRNKRYYDFFNYMYKNKRRPELEQRRKDAADMNPGGFWETQFTVDGLAWRPELREQFAKWEKGEDTKIMKVVSGGLYGTDPRYVAKIVYVLREPHIVAKSQERLNRGPLIDGEWLSGHAMKKGAKVFTPHDFIDHTYRAAQFLKENPDIPVHFFRYSDLIEKPKETLNGITDFISGERANREAIAFINPKLNRSRTRKPAGEEWREGEKIYNWLCEEKYSKIVEFYEDYENRATHIKRKRWFCPRAGKTVGRTECELCKTNPVWRKNAKDYSNYKRIKWGEEPCAYDCGFNDDLKDEEIMTPEESIIKNHWLENE